MSERLKQPSLQADYQKMQEFEGFSQTVLNRRIEYYKSFLDREDIHQQSRQVAEMVLAHLMLELEYREGAFDE